MFVITHRKFFFWLTGIVLVAAIGAIIGLGLPIGIDFTGGSLIELQYTNGRPALSVIQEEAAKVPVGAVLVIPTNANQVTIRTRTLTPAEHTAMVQAVSENASTTELAFTSVGPALGSQFAHKALWALIAVVLAIVAYIAFAFRKVSKPVPSWGYGLTVIAILAHDLIIPTGFFAIFAHFTGAEVDSLFVTALLALLGYSVNDTIIIFDRVREHLRNNDKDHTQEEFAETVGKSIRETMTRSINTSLTVILALIALAVLGAQATRTFALVLLVGVVAGTYSSVLLAAPLLVPLSRYFIKK